jgi:type I restriction enzyme S subunit
MNAERLLAHYEKISDAPDAITYLRRFILDLAVRGKLVPQDSNDEPASELLKRIAKEKAKLQRRARSKSELLTSNKPDASIELPKGWTVSPLSELVAVLNGRAYKQTELLSEGTPVLRVGNLFTSNNWYFSDLDLDSDKYCDDGDLIFAWSASFGPFIWNGGKVIYHYHIWKLALHDEANLNKLYLYNFLLQKTREIREAGHGISMLHMTKEKMERLQVPIPPLGEQRRIVAKVDELMGLCDRLENARVVRETTRDRMATASLARLNTPDFETFSADARFALNALPALTTRPDQIKALRQAILNLAVRGKLVPQDGKDEPASELLKRIAQERSELQKTKHARRDGGHEVSGMKETRPLSDGWVWTSIGDVALSMRYGTSTKCEYETKGVPVLRIPNVSSGKVTIEDLKFGPLTIAEAEELKLQRGDLLFIRSNGSLDIVGRAAIVTPESEGMSFAGYLVRVRLSLANINADFIWLAMNSSDVRDQIERPIRSAVGLKNVNLTEFGSLAIPLPPLVEQCRIVSKVNELMALCERLEVSLNNADATRRYLLEALLVEALTPADTRELEAAE